MTNCNNVEVLHGYTYPIALACAIAAPVIVGYNVAMAPSTRAARFVAELAELPADERAEVIDAVRQLPTRPPMQSADALRAELAELAAEVHAGPVESVSADEAVRALRAELDF